jgi:hypothetical protein
LGTLARLPTTHPIPLVFPACVALRFSNSQNYSLAASFVRYAALSCMKLSSNLNIQRYTFNVSFYSQFVHLIPSFFHAQPNLCPNPTCGNCSAWQLQIDMFKFTDWWKFRIQENSSEIPTGSMPRSLDVILHSELVCMKAGDKCVFAGTFIIVPDVSQLGLPGGNNAELQPEANRNGANGANSIGGSGVTGLKSLSVRDLQYKTAFLACIVHDADGRVRSSLHAWDSFNADHSIGVYKHQG